MSGGGDGLVLGGGPVVLGLRVLPPDIGTGSTIGKTGGTGTNGGITPPPGKEESSPSFFRVGAEGGCISMHALSIIQKLKVKIIVSTIK